MSVPKTTREDTQAPPVGPAAALTLVRDRAQRLSAELPVGEFASTTHVRAVLGIATDLLDVVAQLAETVPQ